MKKTEIVSFYKDEIEVLKRALLDKSLIVFYVKESLFEEDMLDFYSVASKILTVVFIDKEVSKEISLNENEASCMRDLSADFLTSVGFDKEYRPNKDGIILERLIDKLYNVASEED